MIPVVRKSLLAIIIFSITKADASTSMSRIIFAFSCSKPKLSGMCFDFVESWELIVRKSVVERTQFVYSKLLVLDWSWCFIWLHGCVQHTLYIVLGLSQP